MWTPVVLKMPKRKDRRHVSTIDPYATCVTLSLPQEIACSVCYDKLDCLTATRKRKKEERCKSACAKCKQLWNTKILKLDHLTDGEIFNSRRQCNYLNLAVKDVTLVEVHSKSEREMGDTGNCCGAPKMLALIGETPDNTDILTHGKNCHIDLSESQTESALDQTPAATQTGLAHVLANQDEISEAEVQTPAETQAGLVHVLENQDGIEAQVDQNVTLEKNDDHLFERVAKRRLSALEKDANRWREMKKAMKRKNMLAQTLAESL